MELTLKPSAAALEEVRGLNKLIPYITDPIYIACKEEYTKYIQHIPHTRLTADTGPLGCRYSAFLYMLICKLWKYKDNPIFPAFVIKEYNKFVHLPEEIEGMKSPNGGPYAGQFKNPYLYDTISKNVLVDPYEVIRSVEYLIDSPKIIFMIGMVHEYSGTKYLSHYFIIKKLSITVSKSATFSIISSFSSDCASIKQYETELSSSELQEFIDALNTGSENVEGLVSKYFLDVENVVKTKVNTENAKGDSVRTFATKDTLPLALHDFRSPHELVNLISIDTIIDEVVEPKGAEAGEKNIKRKTRKLNIR